MLTCVQTIFLEARTIFLHMNRVSQRTNSNNAKTNNVSWFMNAMCDAIIPVHKMHTFHINIQIGLSNPHFLQMMMITHSYSLRKYPTSQQQQKKIILSHQTSTLSTNNERQQIKIQSMHCIFQRWNYAEPRERNAIQWHNQFNNKLKSECITEKAKIICRHCINEKPIMPYFMNCEYWKIACIGYALFGHSRLHRRNGTKNEESEKKGSIIRMRCVLDFSFMHSMCASLALFACLCSHSEFFMQWPHSIYAFRSSKLSRFTNYRSDANDYGHQYDLLIKCKSLFSIVFWMAIGSRSGAHSKISCWDVCFSALLYLFVRMHSKPIHGNSFFSQQRPQTAKYFKCSAYWTKLNSSLCMFFFCDLLRG